uniref:Uncharacterized protein n=1 Tax=Romanomermis culicivorax TaxID=13658 RepID=A0A915JGF6_ROMCU
MEYIIYIEQCHDNVLELSGFSPQAGGSGTPYMALPAGGWVAYQVLLKTAVPKAVFFLTNSAFFFSAIAAHCLSFVGCQKVQPMKYKQILDRRLYQYKRVEYKKTECKNVIYEKQSTDERKHKLKQHAPTSLLTLLFFAVNGFHKLSSCKSLLLSNKCRHRRETGVLLCAKTWLLAEKNGKTEDLIP